MKKKQSCFTFEVIHSIRSDLKNKINAWNNVIVQLCNKIYMIYRAQKKIFSFQACTVHNVIAFEYGPWKRTCSDTYGELRKLTYRTSKYAGANLDWGSTFVFKTAYPRTFYFHSELIEIFPRTFFFFFFKEKLKCSNLDFSKEKHLPS